MTKADAVKAALAKLTPGPWEQDSRLFVNARGRSIATTLSSADASGIVTIINALPGLLVEHEADVEQLRVQLAACGVAAFGNTREALEQAKELAPGAYGYSASYADVVKAIEREVNERERADRAEADLEQAVAWGWTRGMNAVDRHGDCDDTPEEALAAWRERRAAERTRV